MQSLSNIAAALKGETVDAALLPVSTARKLMDEVAPSSWAGSATRRRGSWVRCLSRRDVADKRDGHEISRRAYRADREYHDVILAAVTDGKAPINDQTKPLIADHRQIHQSAGRAGGRQLSYIDPDGKLDVRDVANQIDWLQGQGFVDKGFGVDAIIAERIMSSRILMQNGPDRRPYQPPLRRARGARRRLVHGRRRRGGGDRRPLRLRQEHAAVDPRRPACSRARGRRNCAARRRPKASIR